MGLNLTGELEDLRFDSILGETAKYEGGYTEEMEQPTNLGVTQDTYDSYRKEEKLPLQDVKNIEGEEAKNLYHRNYYVKPQFNKLTDGLAEIMFDFGVHSGPARATKALQKTIGTKEDGKIGPKTLKATEKYIEENGEKETIQKVVDDRVELMRKLIKDKPEKYKKYENGWKDRIKNIKSKFD